MQDIKVREEKMKDARKNTPWRDFVKEICSRRTLVFYKNNNLISRYPDNDRKPNIVNHKDYFSKGTIITDSSIEHNLNRSFFSNIEILFKEIQLPSLIVYSSENSDYCDTAVFSKNIYLSISAIGGCENILYSLEVVDNSKNVLNSFMVYDNCENIYISSGVIRSSFILYSKYIDNSSNIWFSSNLVGCSECIFCNDLDNKSFCINNKEYNKEDYFAKKKEILSQKGSFLKNYLNINSFGNNSGSINVSGNFIKNSENVNNGSYSYNVKNGRNISNVGGIGGVQNMYDCYSTGAPQSNDFYGVLNAGGCQNVYNSIQILGSNIYYSYFLDSCSYCLGCIGLKNKSFCILNKQYTKEERFEKANEIFAQMEKDGTLGKFFPPFMNPFYFNDTVAYLIDDTFTKEEVTKEGYLRRDEEIKVDIPEGSEVVLSTELDKRQGFDAEGNRTINPEILKKVIKDPKGNAYRIVKMEYDFLMKYGLPLPELHWLDRIKLGFKFK